MRKSKLLFIATAVSIMWMGFAATLYGSGSGSEKNKVFELGANASEYKLTVFGYVETATVEGIGEDGKPFRTTAMVMEKPKRESDGTYTLFEVQTSDKNAYTLDAYPGLFSEGQISSFTRNFESGKVAYSVTGKIMEEIQDKIFTFPFMVLDKQGGYVNDFSDIRVVFSGSASLTYRPPAAIVAAKPATAQITVNDSEVGFQAYLIEGSHYFKLRDVAKALNGSEKQFQVKWDEGLNRIDLQRGKAYTPVGGELAASNSSGTQDKQLQSGKLPVLQGKLSQTSIFVDGEKAALTSYKIGGSHYIKLRDIAAAVDFAVTWDSASRTVGIATSSGYTPQ
ncbi:hypothetical protein ACX93W_02570 [Paenibacillus sp. CAU 1782]